MAEDPVARKRRMNNIRQQQWRARQSQETLDRLRMVDRTRKANRLKNKTPEQTNAWRIAASRYEANRRKRVLQKNTPIQQVFDGFYKSNESLVKSRKKQRADIKHKAGDLDEDLCLFLVQHSADGQFNSCQPKGKNSTNEHQNLDQDKFDNFTFENMMEVKHSPVGKMEFRSSTNGLPDEEEEDLDTLFENGDGKSLTPSSDESDTKAPILNGINKHAEVLTTTEILDRMDIDIVKDEELEETEQPVKKDSMDVKKENEETELFDVVVDDEPTSADNAKTTEDASKVRDTGDDLDTLLSKINDLVEDCMETRAASKGAATHDVVEIPDDDDSDEVSIKLEKKSEEKATHGVDVKDSKDETKPESSSKAIAKATIEKVAEKVTSAPPPEEKMDVDDDCDDIVCLDSPEASRHDDDEMMEKTLIKEENLNNDDLVQTDKEPAKEREEVIIKKSNAVETLKASAQDKDDEIFLIDDDDDDEPMKEPTKNEEPAVKSSENVDDTEELKTLMELDKEIEVKVEEITKPVGKQEEPIRKVSSVEKPLANDDDEIVCLDDSFEEPEKNLAEAKKDATKKVEDAKKVVKEEEKEIKQEPEEVKEIEKEEQKVTENAPEKVAEIVTVKVEEKTLEKETLETESLLKESVKKEIPEQKPEHKVIEKVEEKISEIKVEKVVEKQPESLMEDLPKKVGEETKAGAKDTPVEDRNNHAEPTDSEKTSNDDDIVILDDDDEDGSTSPPAAIVKTADEKSSTDSEKKSPPSPAKEDDKVESTSAETSTVKPTTILSDNSDNARDGVEEKDEALDVEAKVTEEKITPVSSELNSCSNSSNSLLRETEKQSRQPPAKRIRLSQDEEGSRQSIVSQDDTKSNTVDDDEIMEVSAKETDDNKSLKRVHSTESISSDFKKPKTDEDSSVKSVEEVESEGVKSKDEGKPFSLYPPPKLDAPIIDLSLDFLRRFKKSVHKMNKSDLEELVLQKIVEAIVHKSEFSEMRDLIEKQEKIIVSHRSKISELNKQFRDLEMVHNRVLKDLETKNSQFIMPVKITRAVGLQVYFPNKKNDQPLQGSTASQSSSTPMTRSVSNAGATQERSLPTHSPATISSAVKPAAITPNSNTSTTVLTNVQQPTTVQRRGCVQKLTPMRPDTPRNSPLNRNYSTQGVPTVSSSTPSPAAAKDPSSTVKILNRSPVQKPVQRLSGSIPLSASSPVAVQQTVEKQKTIIAPPGIATKKAPIRMSPVESKKVPKTRQSDPQIVAQPLPVASTIVQPLIPPSVINNPAAATPKPVSKSVIDLTDEDDVVPATPTTNSPRTPIAPSPSTPVARVVTTGNNTTNRGPYKVSVVPQQNLQQSKPNPPKQTPARPLAPLAPKPNGAAVAVRQVPANPSRYRHPAPLPNQPIHSSNPAWKLPPARPTIRISNLESGIVISWTIEDTAKEKYAESTSYQIYAYQETSGPPLVESWRHVGDVKAMLLPMAVTLTQFQEGQRYYFAVRAVDSHNRCGPFSYAKTWS